MPKYSNGDRLLGRVSRYAAISEKTAMPPTSPMRSIHIQSSALDTVT